MIHKTVLSLLAFTLFTPTAKPLTLHMDVTPQLAGTNGVVMKRIEKANDAAMESLRTKLKSVTRP